MRRKRMFFILLILFLALWVHLPAQTGTAESILVRITEHLSVFEYEQAIALFDAIALPERNSTRLRLLEASVLSSAGKFTEARAIVESISSNEPNNTDALFILAAIEGVLGRTRQQQAALERIIAIEPNNAEALVSIGNLNLANRNIRSAAAFFHRAFSAEPENPGALLGLGRAFRMNQEWEDAELYLSHAVQLYPDMAEARIERARFYRGRGHLLLALEDLNEAKRIDPDNYWIAIDRGTLLVDMNIRALALEEFNRAIELSPGEFLAYIYSSALKDEFGDREGAERDYEILARMRPEYYFAFEGLGLHKMRRGQWAEARNAFMEAYRQAPDEHLYALLAAISWMHLEDITAPRAFLNQVIPRVPRDSFEWHMFRLFHDLTTRNFSGETNMIVRLDRETNETLKTQMLFYMAMYYEVRGNTNLANRNLLMAYELNVRAIPEFRLIDWMLTDRNLKPF